MSEQASKTNTLKFSICLDTVYTKYDYYDRVRYAAEQGYDGIELWNIAELNLDRLENTCKMEGIRIANMNALDTWNMNLSEATPKIKKSMEDSFKIADAVQAEHILLLTGNQKGRHAASAQTIISNLMYYSELAEAYGIKMGVEALNTLIDHPGYLLNASCDAFDIVKSVNNPYAGVVFDIYHMQIMEGNILTNMIGNIDLISHIHSAGCPGRHEHSLGELNYPLILEHIAMTPYQGYIGCEYWPSYDDMRSPADVLAHLKGQ